MHNWRILPLFLAVLFAASAAAAEMISLSSVRLVTCELGGEIRMVDRRGGGGGGGGDESGNSCGKVDRIDMAGFSFDANGAWFWGESVAAMFYMYDDEATGGGEPEGFSILVSDHRPFTLRSITGSYDRTDAHLARVTFGGDSRLLAEGQIRLRPGGARHHRLHNRLE
jgi:hypothetical protein